MIRPGASATVNGNTVSHFRYEDQDLDAANRTEAFGLLNYQASRVTASGDTFSDVEWKIYTTEGKLKGHVKP